MQPPRRPKPSKPISPAVFDHLLKAGIRAGNRLTDTDETPLVPPPSKKRNQ